MALPNPSDPTAYTYPWPLQGYENLPPLPEEKNEDGKSLRNEPSHAPSKAYEEFPEPLRRDRRGGFDIHVYFREDDEQQLNYARALWERIRREFPELRIYRVWDKPIGPHPRGMFEVNVLTPAQFGAFVPWLAIWRGPLSALVHPNTAEPGVAAAAGELRDHSQRAIWMGERLTLDLSPFEEAAAAGAGESTESSS
ncbi:hypothetical protein S7711_04714 [Stachybotrys chartarum IBT 7711]|uniref:Dopa 4,5-dioxygenase n=1 Tax=Stachybotrys chartarum (strain CBS 109288 / IBT 7711) TaxID=1280523 RepID=A0A084AP03_STACB|nr:hypothetical protein S7711_04714 [Stachybotrys chartarum IBT 7711]KFA53728.1 hypothetical protein S40293_01640 [Stachybotrys chartarum IBT 40293]